MLNLKKRKNNQKIESNKKTKYIPQLPKKIIEKIFNFINDPKDFQKLSLVNKEWQKILDNHDFWNKHIEYLNFKKMKQKTPKVIFIKNISKLCHCKQNLKKNNQ